MLHYGDALSMAHSLETRNPFLSHNLLEKIYSCSRSQLFSFKAGKAFLRSYLSRLLPATCPVDFSSPMKSGFANTIQVEFSSLDSPSIKILLEAKTLNRPFWDGSHLNQLLGILESISLSRSSRLSGARLNMLYRALLLSFGVVHLLIRLHWIHSSSRNTFHFISSYLPEQRLV